MAQLFAIGAFFFVFLIPPHAYGEFQRTKLAVLNFKVIGRKCDNPALGEVVSEWFITSIVKTGRFEVVERNQLNKILQEQKLGLTGIIDQKTASKIGKVLGADAIITGSIVKLKDSVEINSRVVNAQNGSIIAAENVQAYSEDVLRATMDQLTSRIMINFPLTGYIVNRTDNIITLDLGQGSGLQAGTEFEVFREGEVVKHPKTGKILDIRHIYTGKVRITQVDQNIAEGEILEEKNGGIQYGQQVKSAATSKPGKSQSTAKLFTPPKTIVKNAVKIKKPNYGKISLDTFDTSQIHQILEFKRSGEYTHWLNSTTGNVFNAKPHPAFSRGNDSRPCRKIEIDASGPDGAREKILEAYCRNISSGVWTKMDKKKK